MLNDQLRRLFCSRYTRLQRLHPCFFKQAPALAVGFLSLLAPGLADSPSFANTSIMPRQHAAQDLAAIAEPHTQDRIRKFFAGRNKRLPQAPAGGGLALTVAQQTTRVSTSQAAPPRRADISLNGQGAADNFGYSVAAAGDFNGDGKPDIVISAPFDDNNGKSASGSVFIFFNGAEARTGAADVILEGQSAGDNFGFSVASAGDFNGDGKTDVIVGAPFDDNNVEVDSGSAFIFFGGVTGVRRADADADVIIEGQSAGDNFGYSVASAGDFNGDGKADIIGGAPFDDNNGESASGSAFIFFGGITGTHRVDADADVILNGQSAGDNFGFSVAPAGNVNGDAKADVIVGAPFDDNNGEIDSGSAFVFFGGVTGARRADADADIILNGQSGDDQLGSSVASAGDFNGDGKTDVIVGAPFDDNNDEDDSGSAFIFFGDATGTRRADADADVILNGQSEDDGFGASVATAGDFNGDGKTDVIVGASGDDNNDEEDSGGAFVFFGNAAGTRRADADADVILKGLNGGDNFGTTVASVGDINGDGKADIIVGAPGSDNRGANDSGSAFLFLGGKQR